MEDYFNVSTYFKALTAGNVLTRLVNSLIDAVNEHDHLPKILIFIIICDLLQDMDVYNIGIHESIKEATRWLIGQISIIIHCKRVELADKKPGSIYSDDPRMIFIRMLHRVEHQQQGSHADKVLSLHAKFNDALNDAVAGTKQQMMTIMSCNMLTHFDRWGKLSEKGKHAYLREMDELIERFDLNKIKLLPNPKAPSATRVNHNPQHRSWESGEFKEFNVPPAG